MTVKAREKIKAFEELERLLDGARSAGKKVVHCHGVFDLLHIGHIRHFEEARRLGDILIVTLTPDPHVNKGPHRPAFPQELRAEAVASLGCVDYVAVNLWPDAVQTIRRLKPHFYVKGPDYKDASKDHTGLIREEEAAVRAVGGRLVITDDITFSSSRILREHLPVLPPETQAYLSDLAGRHPPAKILEALERTRDLKVLVVGEAVIDEYQYCNAIGKSSKEPMLAVKLQSTEKFAGGILAVANHVSSLVRRVGLVTTLGERESQEAFIRSKFEDNVEPSFLYKKGAPTIVKRRFIEKYFFTKLLVIYEMDDAPPTREENQLLLEALEKKIPQFDLVIVVDFGHGMLSPEAVELLCAKSKFLAVNAQSNAGNLGYHTISRYPRADYICMAEGELRLEVRDRTGDLKSLVGIVAKRLRAPQVLITKGNTGCLAYREGEGLYEAPALTQNVVDRMGAGDASLAVTSLLAATGAPMEVLAFVGNAVGAEAVATVGHRSYIERSRLLKHMEGLLK